MRAIPISEKKRKGTYQPSRDGNKMAVEDKALALAPEWFSELMKEAWDDLTGRDYVKATDTLAAQHLCVLYERFRQDIDGTRAMTASERQVYNSLSMHFCGTPQSRAKTPAQPVKKSDEWAQFG